ncbi:MAG: hypothetical protein EXR49_07495 [Dehalococcoidia bacterium]|nr:hypothetical protein [Dehalococcoidia bacterium]
MLKVELTKVRAHVSFNIERRGSVLKGTVNASIPKVITRYEIESPASPEAVANAVRQARAGCFVRAALIEPTVFEETTLHNGRVLQI